MATPRSHEPMDVGEGPLSRTLWSRRHSISHGAPYDDDVSEYVIETKELTKDFGSGRGISDLTLTVESGEAFGYIGPNGAGKTTTLRLLMDLLKPTRGTASIFGLDIAHHGVEIRRRCGFLPGEAPDYPNQTGEQILDLLAHMRGGVEAATITSLAKDFDLDLHRRYRTYSHGNKQKVWLISVFMHNPDLIFLDEPTTGLDPLMQQVFRKLVMDAKARGATIFLSSHVLSEVEEICDRVGIVYGGTLRSVGKLSDLRLASSHQVEATVGTEISESALTKLDGITAVNVSDHHIGCRVQGDMGPLLHLLTAHHATEVVSTVENLEELFLREYGHGQQS